MTYDFFSVMFQRGILINKLLYFNINIIQNGLFANNINNLFSYIIVKQIHFKLLTFNKGTIYIMRNFSTPIYISMFIHRSSNLNFKE